MKNVNTEELKGIMSFDELCEILGIEAALISKEDIRNGCIDNYSGEQGINVEFNILVDDSKEYRLVHEYQIEVTDWYTI